MLLIIRRKPIAVGSCLRERHVDYGIVILSLGVDKGWVVCGILRIGNGGVANIGIVSIGTAKNHPSVGRVVVLTRVDKAQELLFQTNFTVLGHLVDNGLHFFHKTVLLRLAFEFAQLRFLPCHHFVVAKSHLFEQGFLVFFGGVVLVLHQCVLCALVKPGTLFLDKGSVRVVKFEFALHEVGRSDKLACLNGLMHCKIVSHQAVLVNGESITAVNVGRERSYIVVFAGGKRAAVWGITGNDVVARSYFVAVDAFEFHVGHAFHLEVYPHAAECAIQQGGV